jgi:uncharacterized membrane protein (UPF0127 family)
MRSIRVTDDRGRSFAAVEAETRRERMLGLRGRPDPEPLLLRHTRSVHTFGMLVPIDVVLLDRRWVVVRIVRMRPGRVLLPRGRVGSVFEIREAAFEVGSTLRIEPSEEPGADRRESRNTDERQSGDRDRGEPARPGGKRHGLAPAGRRRHETEPLEEHPHVLPSAEGRED